MGVNEDTLDMLKGIFEEQRELTDEEMQAYKDMLHRKKKMMKMPWEDDKDWNNTATTLGKEKDMELIRGRKTPLKNAIVVSDSMGVMNVETAIKHIRRALDVPNRDGFALVDDEALFKALEILTYVGIVIEEEGESNDNME